MSSPPGHYDLNLLSAVPAPTRAQLQEGYSTDLLNPTHGNVTPPFATPPTNIDHGLAAKEYSSHGTPKTLPFWRTRKGMVIIVIALVIVVAAVIGGAVGGSVHKGQTSPPVSGNATSINGPPVPQSSDGGVGIGSVAEPQATNTAPASALTSAAITSPPSSTSSTSITSTSM